MRRYRLLPVVIPTCLLLTSCGRGPDGPYMDYCKTITAKLVGGNNLEWTSSKQTAVEGDELTVNLAYKAGNGAGTASCHYEYVESQDPTEEGDFDSAPHKVVLNNREIGQQELLKAARDATVQVIRESAQQASETARHVAHDAADKARDVAHSAAGKVRDAADDVQKALEK